MRRIQIGHFQSIRLAKASRGFDVSIPRPPVAFAKRQFVDCIVMTSSDATFSPRQKGGSRFSHDRCPPSPIGDVSLARARPDASCATPHLTSGSSLCRDRCQGEHPLPWQVLVDSFFGLGSAAPSLASRNGRRFHRVPLPAAAGGLEKGDPADQAQINHVCDVIGLGRLLPPLIINTNQTFSFDSRRHYSICLLHFYYLSLIITFMSVCLFFGSGQVISDRIGSLKKLAG